MGRCKYCGEPAGLFKREHKECAQKFKEQKEKKLLLMKKEKENQIIRTHTQYDSIINQLKNDNLEINTEKSFVDYGINSFLKKEKLVLIRIQSELYETKSKITYEGGSQGVSFRIAKGVSYRVGKSKGERVESEVVKFIDEGYLYLSTAGIYFNSNAKTMRVRYNKIAGFKEFSDGFSIRKDTATAKPIIFTLDPKFSSQIFKIVMLLANNDKK